MEKLFKSLLCASLAMLLGCKTVGSQESYAAVISNPSPESLLEITKAVSTAMDGQSVKIAEQAFTANNTLSIMANTKSLMGNDPLNGRIQARPQHFELLIRGSECLLVHIETGEEYALKNVVCTRLEPDNN